MEVRTKKGKIQFNGIIDTNTETIFRYGYCANFAKILHQRMPKLLLSYVKRRGNIDHWFCTNKNMDMYYDITGCHSKDEFMNVHQYNEGVKLHNDIEMDEYYNINM